MKCLARRFEHRSRVWMLPILLTVPIATAALAPVADTMENPDANDRSMLLRPITMLVGEAEAWQVVARFEQPATGGWSLVVRHEGPVVEDAVDPRDVAILSRCPISNALLIYTQQEAAWACRPLTIDEISNPRFPRLVRRSMQYRARVFGVAGDPTSLRSVREVLEMRVRELDKPVDSLTPASD